MSEQTQSTSLATLRQGAQQPREAALPEISVGFGTLQSFELTQRVSKMLASSNLVPKEFQGNIANCVIALNMAHRIGADPLMVMQNLYIVYNRPSWSSQFLIATFNSCGRFSALRYEFKGKEGTDAWSCRAVAVELKTGERLEGPWVSIDLAKKEGWYSKSGSKWQTMPEQMLRYRAASWFVRAYAPEIAMGLHTVDEAKDMVVDVEPIGETVDVQTLRDRAPEVEAQPMVEVPTSEESPEGQQALAV